MDENVEILENSDLTVIDPTPTSPALVEELLTQAKLMEVATMLSKSTIIPITYQNRPENCYIAIDMAFRIGVSPMMVMQNLYVIQGKPIFSGQAITAMIRSNPQFKDVELHFVGEEGKDTWGAYVTAIKISTGKILKGGTVTLAIAKKEGWFQKAGSKWQTMPEIMLAYRAHTWFGRVYCPELLMGLQSPDEVADVSTGSTQERNTPVNPYGGKQ